MLDSQSMLGETMADKKLYQQAGLEMIAIVFSVMLALLLNDLWQDRRTAASHEKTLSLIKVELNSNRAELEEAIAYYKEISPKISAVLQDGVTDEEAREVMTYCCELISGGSGRTAHEMAIITGLYAWLEPDTSVVLIAPFVGQEDLNIVSQGMTSGLMNSDMTDPEEFFARYNIIAMSLAPSFEELLVLTNAAIDSLEALDVNTGV
jgi:hypothetical protein